MNEATLQSLKAQHGALIRLEIDGKDFLFRPLTRAMITDLKKRLSTENWRALELSVNACRICCVYGQEEFDAIAERFPLAFAGNAEGEGVIDALMTYARGGAQIRTV